MAEIGNCPRRVLPWEAPDSIPTTSTPTFAINMSALTEIGILFP
jgi:hypothetical protein